MLTCLACWKERGNVPPSGINLENMPMVERVFVKVQLENSIICELTCVLQFKTNFLKKNN